MAPVLWLTGAPGVGKTTVIARVAETLVDGRPGGFYTEEIREHGVRQGFRLQSFRGGSAVMAHVKFTSHPCVGRYGVDVAAVDTLASAALAPDPLLKLYLVDEVGKMECMSARFVAALHALLNRPTTVVGTIARFGGGVIAELKRWPGSTLWEVTRENREGLPGRVLTWLGRES